MRSLVILFIACVMSPAISRAAQIKMLSGREVEVRTDNMVGPATPGAPAPAWFDLQNHANAERHVLLLVQSSQSSSRRTVTLAPHEHRSVTLPVPGELLPGTLQVKVLESGAKETAGIAEDGSVGAAWLVVGSANQWRPMAAEDEDDGPLQVRYIEGALLPDLFQVFGYNHGVIFLDETFRNLTQPQRRALEDYVLSGGQVIFGPGASRAPALDTWSGQEPATHLGWGSILVCPDEASLQKALHHQTEPHATWSSVTFSAHESLQHGLLPNAGGPPVRVFVALILLFALLVGPGSLLIARRHGSHTMLITIPAIALTTSIGIGIYGVTADGLNTTTAAFRSLTRLDARTGRAVTFGVCGYFASMSRTALTFPAGSADILSDLPRTFELDWTDGLLLKGDVIPARTYVERSIVSIQPSNARLVLSNRSVTNELGGHLVRGIARVDGKLWSFSSAAQGKTAEFVLVPEKEESAEKSEAWVALNRITQPLDGRTGRTVIDAPLSEGEFAVELSDAPFLPTGGLPVTMNPSIHIVRGELSR